MLRIDLGCGKNKQTGFIGMDRYALSGVDVVADMNGVLPFRDDSVDLLFASHSLEHSDSLLGTMKEVYRVCKHGAQVCIVAPYSEQRLNQANPYHKWVFNEHTTRFWTDCADTPIDPQEYCHPHSPLWGLSGSDNSNPGIDLRTVRMEYFYFPKYAGLPPSEQRQLRQERTDVCEQIMYHLIVWKDDGEGGGRLFDDYVAEFQPYEPAYIPVMRNRGREMALQNSAAAHSESLTREITRLHEHCAAQTEALGRLTNELRDAAASNRILRDEASRTERELEFARAEIGRESAPAAASREEIASLVRQNQDLKTKLESNDVLRAKLGLTRAELETTTTLLGLQRQKEEGLNGEIMSARREAATAVHEAERWKTLWSAAQRSLSAIAVETRIPEFAQVVRVGGFIIGRDRQIQGLPKGFGPLREYCDRHFRTARACIALGGDLAEVPYREYVVPFALERLTAVSFAIRPLVPEASGVLGIEIVSDRSEILAHVRGELTAVQRDGVTEFRLPAPLTGLEKNWLLRVFVRDAETPVSVYELVRGGLFRGPTQSFPLVSFS